MNRVPPIEVRRILRQEVGFGCPVQNCGSPYLHWHHFDPPWAVKQHHDPAGMIALCGEHHDKADVGTYTDDQLREFKKQSQNEISGRFDWMRDELIVKMGGTLHLCNKYILTINSRPVVWVTRDERGYMLLNIDWRRKDGTVVCEMIENFWTVLLKPDDIDCPPNGRKVDIRYSNGDRLSIEFVELKSIPAFEKALNYPFDPNDFTIPILAVKVLLYDESYKLQFKSAEAKISGFSFGVGVMSGNETAFALSFKAN